MIHSFKVINDSGDELMVELARPEKSGFAVRSIDGLGPVKASINSMELATQDGTIFNSARTSYRNIIFDLIYYPIYSSQTVNEEIDPNIAHRVTIQDPNQPTRLSVEDIRQLSYKYFPIKGKITLYFYTDNRIAAIDGYVESNEPDIFDSDCGGKISVICPYPYFRELSSDGYDSFSNVIPIFHFEFSNNNLTRPLLVMSEFSNVAEKNIKYSGDVETGILLELYLDDRIGDVTIYNSTLSKSFTLHADKIESIIGSQISSGDKILISSIFRNKFIKYYKGTSEYNILSAMDRNSDWLTMVRGDNLYAYSAVSGGENIYLSILYPILYSGI